MTLIFTFVDAAHGGVILGKVKNYFNRWTYSCNCGADPVFGPLSFLKFLFRTVIEGAVAHSREELFSKAFPQETRKGHHFFGHGLSHAQIVKTIGNL